MSEMVKALGLALGARKYDKPPIACCPSCHAPLIGTIIWPGAEFYCLDCGGHHSFVAPEEGDPDDAELVERLKQYEAEWDEHVEVEVQGRQLTPASRDWLNERRKEGS